MTFDEIWRRKARQVDLSFSLRKMVSGEGGSSCHFDLAEIRVPISTLHIFPHLSSDSPLVNATKINMCQIRSRIGSLEGAWRHPLLHLNPRNPSQRQTFRVSILG